jgi:HEPN domain-containing protein
VSAGGVDTRRPRAKIISVPDRSADWLTQAERDLAQARDSAAAGRHEWACFAAQQAAEKAAKALHLHLGQEAWGHVVWQLLEELPASAQAPAELLDRARVLDAHYIPTRYPNGHPAGAPGAHYGALQSREAIAHAAAILDFVRSAMA